MLTLALEESLQVASNPAFATPDEENIFGGHGDLICKLFCLVFVGCKETSVGVGEDKSKGCRAAGGGGIYNARDLGASQLRGRRRKQF
jgi:hypothetical protein